MTGMPSLLAVTLHSLPLRRIVSPISGGGCALEASISKVPSGKRISKLRPGMSAGCPPAATPNLGRRLGYTSPSRTGPSWSATSTPRSSARPVGGSSSTRKIASRSAIDRATRACSASSATRSASPVSSKPAAYKSAARAATFSSRTETPASLTRRRYPAQWSVKRKPFRPDLAGPQARHRQGEGWVLSRRDPGSADFVPARTQSQTGQPVSALEAGVRDRKPKASSPS